MTCEKMKKDDEIGQKIMICNCNSFLNRIIFFLDITHNFITSTDSYSPKYFSLEKQFELVTYLITISYYIV